MPISARDFFHGIASTYGLLSGAVGVGALVGAMHLAARKSIAGIGNLIVISTAMYGFALLLFGFNRLLPVALLNIILTATLQFYGVIDAVSNFFKTTLGFRGSSL